MRGMPFAKSCLSRIHLHALLLASLALLQPALLQAQIVDPTNTLRITELQGVARSNYLVRIGRPFVQGEIAQYPQAYLSGQPLETQADVKNRYSDGSVKFAILTFYLPTLGANASRQVTFGN